MHNLGAPVRQIRFISYDYCAPPSRMVKLQKLTCRRDVPGGLMGIATPTDQSTRPAPASQPADIAGQGRAGSIPCGIRAGPVRPG